MILYIKMSFYSFLPKNILKIPLAKSVQTVLYYMLLYTNSCVHFPV